MAELNKELIIAEGSDNPMEIQKLQEHMKDFLQTSYEAFFFIEQDVVVEYALVKMECEPLYLRQFMITQVQECDKEASWDGDILLYRENDFRVENIEYKIPVQVKGKNDNSLLKRQFIT